MSATFRNSYFNIVIGFLSFIKSNFKWSQRYRSSSLRVEDDYWRDIFIVIVIDVVLGVDGSLLFYLFDSFINNLKKKIQDYQKQKLVEY